MELCWMGISEPLQWTLQTWRVSQTAKRFEAERARLYSVWERGSLLVAVLALARFDGYHFARVPADR